MARLTRRDFVKSTTAALATALYEQKAGDGDRTRDVQGRKTLVFHGVSRPERPACQLGNMRVVCLSKTSLFNTFIESSPFTSEFLENSASFIDACLNFCPCLRLETPNL